MYRPISSVRKRMILRWHQNKEARYKALGDEFYRELIWKANKKAAKPRRKMRRRK